MFFGHQRQHSETYTCCLLQRILRHKFPVTILPKFSDINLFHKVFIMVPGNNIILLKQCLWFYRFWFYFSVLFPALHYVIKTLHTSIFIIILCFHTRRPFAEKHNNTIYVFMYVYTRYVSGKPKQCGLVVKN